MSTICQGSGIDFSVILWYIKIINERKTMKTMISPNLKETFENNPQKMKETDTVLVTEIRNRFAQSLSKTKKFYCDVYDRCTGLHIDADNFQMSIELVDPKTRETRVVHLSGLVSHALPEQKESA